LSADKYKNKSIDTTISTVIMKKKNPIFENEQDAESYINAMRNLPIHQEPADEDLEAAFDLAERIHDLLEDSGDS
jgi:hypothetical protein